MPRAKRVPIVGVSHDPPAISVEDRYDQLITLAVNLAEERLRDKSASNQLISEIIRYGSTKEKLQREKLEREAEMLRVKAEVLESARRTEELYANAIRAMGIYDGSISEDEEDEYAI